MHQWPSSCRGWFAAVQEPQYSKKASARPDWEPGWDTERFSLKLLCDDKECAEIVFAIGHTEVTEYFDEESEQWGLISMLNPNAFFPAPPLIGMEPEVPDTVGEEVRKSFDLYWVDLGACANRLRVSVELLLDHVQVPRTRTDKNGKSVRLDLNARIEFYERSDPDHAQTLTALRMIGNLGSHGENVNREALLDAFEIYEYALEEVCGQRKARIDALRKRLIASKGSY